MHLQPDPLPAQRQEALRSWLSKADDAIRVTEALALTEEAKAMAAFAESDDHEGQMAVAVAAVKRASKYRHFQQVLKELTETATFNTVKITT